MADRIGVINKGGLILVEDKARLMQQAGQEAADAAAAERRWRRFPPALAAWRLELSADGRTWSTASTRSSERSDIAELLRALAAQGIEFKDLQTAQSSLEDIFVSLVQEARRMNLHAIRAIYLFEMARTWRTLLQSIAAPVITTSLYFVVFGSAIGSRMASIDGVSYGAFIVPGLIMLSILTESISNASFGIYMPKFAGTIYELLSAPVSAAGDRARLCRRRGHQVDPARPADPGHGAPVRRLLRSRIRCGCWPSWC